MRVYTPITVCELVERHIERDQAAEGLCSKALELEHLLTGTVAQTAENLKAMIARRKVPHLS